MVPADVILAPRWIATVNDDGDVLVDSAVVIEADRIVAVGPRTQVESDYPGIAVVELPNQLLAPGLINAHTHAAMTLLRGLADDLPLEIWLTEHVWPAEAKWVSPEFVRDGTRLAIAEMLVGGVTCFSDMYFFPAQAAAVSSNMGMRIVAGMTCFDNPTPYSRDAADCLAQGRELHRQFHDDPLVTTAVAPHAPYTVSDPTWRDVVALAEELSIPIHTHLHETGKEVEDSVAAYGDRPVDRLARLGAVSDRLIAAHMTTASRADISSLAAAGSSVVHCPESNLKLASGFAPVTSIRDGGVNVALGTDGAASNNDLDMIGEMRTAALLAKGVTADAAALPAVDVLRMATIDAARALHLADQIGSIEVGKQADLLAVRLVDAVSGPVHDPISQFVYTATRHQVSDVWVAGVRRVADGRLADDAAAGLAELTEKWTKRLA